MFEEHPSLAQDKRSSSNSGIISETAATSPSYPSDVETSSALTQGPENTCSQDGSLPNKRAKSLKTGARSGHHACDFCKERKIKCHGHYPCQQCQDLADQVYLENCPKLPPQGRRKNRKHGTACDQCKKSKRSCKGAPPRCDTCVEYKKDCTWSMPVEVRLWDALGNWAAQKSPDAMSKNTSDQDIWTSPDAPVFTDSGLTGSTPSTSRPIIRFKAYDPATYNLNDNGLPGTSSHSLHASSGTKGESAYESLTFQEYEGNGGAKESQVSCRIVPCIRCRQLRIKCDGLQPCDQCKATVSQACNYEAPPDLPPETSNTRKQNNVACDQCRKRKTKCSGGRNDAGMPSGCLSCAERSVIYTWHWPDTKKRANGTSKKRKGAAEDDVSGGGQYGTAEPEL